MLTLYYKPTCVYSQNVLGEAQALGIQFDLKNIASDEVLAAQLVEKGGKRQTPFLEDPMRNVHLYESADIIAYLKEHYGSNAERKTFGGLNVHGSEEVCDSCQ